MSERQLPILLFPRPSSSSKDARSPVISNVQFPSAGRQLERLGPKFSALQNSFDSQRVRLQTTAPQDELELVVVFETIGTISSFVGAVKRIDGLEWLMEADESDIEPDEDFYDAENRTRTLSGSLFLLGTNLQALTEIVSLWERYRANPDEKFDRGFGAWREVFKHLRDVRFWGVQDRLGQDIQQELQEHLDAGEQSIRFEIEAWCYSSNERNQRTAEELSRLIAGQQGQILRAALIPEIAYHGFLVELPADGVRQLLSETPPELALSDRIMFFRPRGQAIAPHGEESSELGVGNFPTIPPASGDPVVALLDGLPLQNHPALNGRLVIDDPDGWESTYEAGDRVHGTAMASLIARGELGGAQPPLGRPVYVRPIMRPDPSDIRSPRAESTPSDELLIDLVHRAVHRIFEGEGEQAPAAPTTRVINLSVGDMQRPFDRTLSPWARLLDWLSFRYRVLFVVSAGNVPSDLTLETERDTVSSLQPEERHRLALKSLLSDSSSRRILAPAEAINALTVGAIHADASTAQGNHSRFDLFPEYGVSPYSCIGHGFRRAIKPDVVLPGGRILYREKHVPPGYAEVEAVSTTQAPGHIVATPPTAGGGNTRHSRGTSNAAALASRGAAQAFEVIDALRAGSPQDIPARFDAVLLKALLAHGADWGDLEQQILTARPDISDRRKQQDFVARFVGYGLADIDRALTCTEQRATLIGVGELRDGEALEFKAPLPPCLNAQTIKRRLTITLAWLTPVNTRNSKYRSARLWISPPADELGVSRLNYQWQHVLRGTLQHEILEGQNALAFVDGNEVVFKVNCAEDGGKLPDPVPFALCVSLEVAEGIELPIYQQIRDRVSVRVGVQP